MSGGAALAVAGNRRNAPTAKTRSPAARRSRPDETTSLLDKDAGDGTARLCSGFCFGFESRAALHSALVDPKTPGAVAFFSIVILTILGSIIAFCIESMLVYESWPGWRPLEVVIVVIFTSEVSLRWWAWPENTCSFLLDPMTMIDVVSIFPFYLDLFLPGNNMDLRWVRVLRLFNLFKVGRHSAGLQFMFRAIVRSIAGLALLAFLLFQALMVFSTFMWMIERGDWSAKHGCYMRADERCSPFQSIAHAGWWGITTMTTVGYGDALPATLPGRYMAGCAMLGGIIMLALPTTVFGSQFAEEYSVMKHDDACRKVQVGAQEEIAELAALREELRQITDELARVLPVAHGKVQHNLELRGKSYYFKPTELLMRDAARSVQEFHRLVEDWCTPPPLAGAP